MSVISIGLVADVGNVATDYTKLAVVYGTLIGFTMISIIVTVGSVMNNGLNRTLVSHCYCSTAHPSPQWSTILQTALTKTKHVQSCYNLISQKVLYMFRATTVYHQEVSCTIQALWYNVGYAVAQLVGALHYKPEGRGFDSRCCHWNFSLT